MDSLISRIGIFFIFIGVIVVALFLASDMAGSPSIALLCAGGLVFMVGVLAWRGGSAPAKETGRFGTLRRLREMSKKKQKPPAKR